MKQSSIPKHMWVDMDLRQVSESVGESALEVLVGDIESPNSKT